MAVSGSFSTSVVDNVEMKGSAVETGPLDARWPSAGDTERHTEEDESDETTERIAKLGS